MKKVSRKWIALIAVVVLAIVGGVIINNHRQVSAANSKGKRTLIVYFSRTQGIYGRNLRIGNTKRIADDIQKKTGGTEFEIRPQKDYPSKLPA